ncbi:MAG: DUF58 domain-containing protein [Nitrospirota bacterium]|nr:MAG: DUF58 domain-containing protein [Nitrospirota bacterium]
MRKIESTKEGRRFLLAIILIGLAAFNTGNNLIYLIFAMMISLLLVSVIASLVNLMKLDAHVELGEPLFANTPFKAAVTFLNHKRIPSYSISVVLPIDVSEKLYAPYVSTGKTVMPVPELSIFKRGKYMVRSLMLRTGFPFIFLHANKSMDISKEVIVYPEMIDVKKVLSGIEVSDTEREALVKGNDGDLFSMREYVYGEESRSIDWKASARTQKTMVREYAKSSDRLASVILDNGTSENAEYFERSVSIAASLCAELINRGYYVRLITCKKVVPYGNGKVHLFKALDILSEIKSVDSTECILKESIEGLSILVISSGTSGFNKIGHLCSGVVDARNI